MQAPARAPGGLQAAPADARRAPAAALVLGLLALWLLATLGWRPLLLPDEGRYAEVAREMLRGDALVPTLYGLPFFHKPPLMYWLDIAAMHLLGVNVLAARIAPALGAWLMGAALYLDLRHRRGHAAAIVALAVLATTPFFFIGGQYANHDMLVAGLVTVAVVSARRAADGAPGRRLRWVVAAWAAMALAVLAKGLIGVVLPMLVVGPWLLAQRRWRDVLALLHPLGPLVALAVAAPWFAAMQARYPGFLDYFFMEQHFRRYSHGGFNNAQPWWFFVPVLLLLTLPWSLWLPSLARRWRDASLGLEAWWVLAVIGFFSLPQSKLVGYALPALAPSCALLAVAVQHTRWWRRAALAAALGCLAIVAALAWKAPGSHRPLAQALAAQQRPGDRVVLVDGAFFDLPFVADLAEPPWVWSDWNDPALPEQDNWRKELHDAARFDPAAGARRLVGDAQVAALACRPGTAWFVAEPHWVPPAALGGALPVLRDRHGTLWRVAGGPRPGCP